MRRIDGLDAYSQELEVFVRRHGLPPDWFAVPDHVALMCQDELHYEETVAIFEHAEEAIDQVVLNGRKIATVRLAGSVGVGNFGKVDWLEVLEPQPGHEDPGLVGIDHVGFVVADLTAVRQTLGVGRPRGGLESGLGTVLNARGQEVLFMDTSLEILVQHNRDANESHPRKTS